MAGVITASQPSWIAPFTGLSPRCFGTLVAQLRHEGADAVRKGRPWSLPLEDRVLLVTAWTLRDCLLKGDGVHHAMRGIARLHNLALSRQASGR